MPTPPRPAKPTKKDLPAPDVQQFRSLLTLAMRAKVSPSTRAIASCQWGVYAFYDFEEEPIYVGQTNERLSVRIRRHLSNQRTDAVGMRVLDPYEIRIVEMWPLFELEGTPKANPDAKLLLNRLERTVYERALSLSKFGVILNEKIPPDVPLLDEEDLPSPFRFPLVKDEVFAERNHPDNRIARRAETIGRLAAVIRERGEVSVGLRRVLVVQAVRLAWLGAQRLAEAEGADVPNYATAIDLAELVAGATDPDPDDETD